MNTLLLAIKNSLLSTLNKRDCQYIFIGNPESVPKQVLSKGVCIIMPNTTSFIPITTGLQYQDTKRLRLIFAKSIQSDLNINAQMENSTEWLMRVMEGRNPDGTLKSTSAISTVLKNLRVWGILQGSVRTNYGTRDIRNIPGGTAIGNITMEQKDIYSLLIN